MGSIGKAIGKVVGGVGKALFGSPARLCQITGYFVNSTKSLTAKP